MKLKVPWKYIWILNLHQLKNLVMSVPIVFQTHQPCVKLKIPWKYTNTTNLHLLKEKKNSKFGMLQCDKHFQQKKKFLYMEKINSDVSFSLMKAFKILKFGQE